MSLLSSSMSWALGYLLTPFICKDIGWRQCLRRKPPLLLVLPACISELKSWESSLAAASVMSSLPKASSISLQRGEVCRGASDQQLLTRNISGSGRSPAIFSQVAAGDSCISAIPCPQLPETCEGIYQGFDQYYKLQCLSVPWFYCQVFEHINISQKAGQKTLLQNPTHLGRNFWRSLVQPPACSRINLQPDLT